MKHYIDKSALVAEIERIMNEQQEICKADVALGKVPNPKNIEVIYQFQEFTKFLDTLEVKEIGVDVGSPEGDYNSKTVQFIDADGNIKEIIFNKAQNGKSALEAIKEEKVDNANKIEPNDYSNIDSYYFKPATKIEPKFKVGDWIVDNNVKTPLLITGISNEKYDVISIYGNDMAFSFREVEHFYHLWTIADAKEGDVLAFDNDTIVIFKDLYNSTTFHSYCHIEDGVFDVSEDNLPDWWEGKGFYPATKEQRDLLFQKMKMTWEIFGMPKIG